MYQLLLTQEQANKLLFELKELAQKYELIISRNSINQLKLKTKDAKNLVLTCTYHDKFNSHINLHDARTGLSLIRINLDNKFHKNLNGKIIKGPRVNIYDINEFSPNKGHFSYMKCHALPYLIFEDSINCVESIIKILEFTNTKYARFTIKIKGDVNHDRYDRSNYDGDRKKLARLE